MKLINVVKPTHICNLNCNYCFNDDVRQPIMKSSVLLRTIKETFEYVRNHRNFSGVEFVWHGGEPLVAGIEYFQEVIDLEEKYSQGISFENGIQTNGLLVNENWAKFFLEHNFAVSVSLDGTREMHDIYRKDYSGRGSFDKVISAIGLLRQFGVEPGIVLVATKAMKGHAREIYSFLIENRLNFQMVSLTKSGKARDAYDEMALLQAEYADLWIELFDLWFRSDPGYVRCQEFEGRLSALLSGYPSGCEGLASCADTNISTDPIGDIYSCATFSGTPTLSYGNIARSSLESLMLSETAISFRTRKVDPQCAKCQWQHVCHGGCMSRAYKISETIDVRDSGCEALWKTWDHMAKRIKEKGLSVSTRHSYSEGEEFSLPSDIAKTRNPLRRVIPIKLIR